MSEFAVLESALDYLDGKIQLDALEACILDIEPSDENSLSSQLIGLLAEASHADWTLNEIREAVASAISPLFERHEAQVGQPRYLPSTLSAVHEVTSVAA